MIANVYVIDEIYKPSIHKIHHHLNTISLIIQQGSVLAVVNTAPLLPLLHIYH